MIPLVDLRAQYDGIRQEIEAAVARVLASGQFALGPEVAAFEQEFAAACGAVHAVGVSSGTSALHLALTALGIGPGDEVITVPFTFVASVAAIAYTGARPVFVDIDPVSYTIDVRQIASRIGARTRAVMPVHLFGQAADLDPILALARAHGLAVVEDACQAHGARYKGRPVGAIGDVGAFSFYPTKNLGAYGEAGLVVTNDPETATKIRMLRDWGQDARYHHVQRGFNARLDGIQGAVLRVKLRHLPRWNARRRAIAASYGQRLATSDVVLPREMAYAEHVFHVYAIRSAQRDVLREALGARGIETGVHYPVPVHLQPAYADLGCRAGEFPVAEQVAREELSLPIYPELPDAAIVHISEAIQEAARLSTARS